MKSPTELTELFRAQGLKVTPQRQCIFRALHGNDRHPTAEAIHEQVTAEMPTVSLRTVYQTLHDLADMGELVELDLGTGSGRFDPNLEPHQHVVCDGCGRVYDVVVDVSPIRTPRFANGFRVDRTEVVFRGRCRACSAAAGS